MGTLAVLTVAFASRLCAVVVMVVVPASLVTQFFIFARFSSGLAAVSNGRSMRDDLATIFTTGQVSGGRHYSVELQVHSPEQVHRNQRACQELWLPSSSRRYLRRLRKGTERRSYQRSERVLHSLSYDSHSNIGQGIRALEIIGYRADGSSTSSLGCWMERISSSAGI